MNLYALFDAKADAYSSFHAEKNDTVASRGFAEAVTQPNSVFGKYPDDFCLVRLVRIPESFVTLRDSVGGDAFVFDHNVVITARQIMDLQPKADGQLSLLKEA